MSLRDNTENTIEETYLATSTVARRWASPSSSSSPTRAAGHGLELGFFRWEIVTARAQFSVLFTFSLEFILSTVAWRWASPSSSSSASPTRAAGHGLELGFRCSP